MKKETCALCARRTLYVSLIFNAILFSVLIVIYHFHYKRLEEIADMMQGAQNFHSLQHPTNHSDISVLDETVCIECEHLGTSVKAEETFYSNITYSDSGQRMCCLKDRSLAELIQKVYYWIAKTDPGPAHCAPSPRLRQDCSSGSETPGSTTGYCTVKAVNVQISNACQRKLKPLFYKGIYLNS